MPRGKTCAKVNTNSSKKPKMIANVKSKMGKMKFIIKTYNKKK